MTVQQLAQLDVLPALVQVLYRFGREKISSTGATELLQQLVIFVKSF